jgi:hypothetical protein
MSSTLAADFRQWIFTIQLLQLQTYS